MSRLAMLLKYEIFFRPKQSSFCGMFPFFGKVWTCFFHGDSRLPCLTWLGFYQRSGWDADPHWDGGPGGHFRNTMQLSSAERIRGAGHPVKEDSKSCAGEESIFERKRSAMVEKILGAAVQ